MDNKQLNQPENGQAMQPVSMELVLKEYETAFHDVLRENMMLKALLAQKNAEGNQGTE